VWGSQKVAVKEYIRSGISIDSLVRGVVGR
jgi:hypothetical protein